MLFSVNLAISAETYGRYHNQRFGYSISYPKDILYPQGESGNGDGQKFLSKNADATLLVYASHNALDKSISQLYKEAITNDATSKPRKTVTYKVLKKNWFVVSGFIAGNIFYEKTVLTSYGYKSFYIEYPESQKTSYDPIVKTVAASFMH